MKELIGRLEHIDPDASAILKVVAYFDGLIEARASRAFPHRAAILPRPVVIPFR